MQPAQTLQATQVQVRVNAFIRSVYNWMAIGLALTGFLAYTTAQQRDHAQTHLFVRRRHAAPQYAVLRVDHRRTGEMVFVLAARVQRMQASTATALFVGYAAINGVTLSSIFLVYAQSTITATFFICAATFAVCSVYGMTTPARFDRGSDNSCSWALIGIVIASLVNLFLRRVRACPMIISYVGVIVFVGLTAYDTQKLKHMALSQPAGLDAGVIRKGAILGALTLYLDFINLFLMLLRIMGNRE